MTAYVLDEMFSVPELRQTAQELSELTRRRSELLSDRSRVAETAAEEHGSKTEAERERTAGSVLHQGALEEMDRLPPAVRAAGRSHRSHRWEGRVSNDDRSQDRQVRILERINTIFTLKVI